MTSDEFIKLVVEKITSFIPDEFPQPIKDIYQTAVDFYGEENVDLQKNTAIEIWKDRISPDSVKDFLYSIGIPNASELFTLETLRLAWDTLLLNTKCVNIVLNSINKERAIERFYNIFYSIIIHFHNITVTNERGNSTIIEDIYANVPISLSGHIDSYIYWMRTTFSYKHYVAKYIHSHVYSGQGAEWLIPCLGTGPIKLTMVSLEHEYDLSLWSLFWLELDKCIRTESTVGGPYYRMSDISSNREIVHIWRDFINKVYPSIEKKCLPIKRLLLLKLLHSDKLKYAFHTNHTEIVTPFVDFTVLCSNLLFELFKELSQADANELLNNFITQGYITYCQIKSDGSILSYGNSNTVVPVEEKPLDFKFKKKVVVQKVIKEEDDNDTDFFILLHQDIVTYFYNQLTTMVNYFYANKVNSSKKR